MNRQQRRAQARIEKVNLREVTFPHQMTLKEVDAMAQDRVQLNYVQTKHPYHHLTANGVIVDADPTLEYYLKRLEQDEEYKPFLTHLKANLEALIARTSDIPRAIPVNRKFYGHDPYERH